MITFIKFVRKANQWCLTYFVEDGKKNLSQKQEWFDTKEKALERKKEL